MKRLMMLFLIGIVLTACSTGTEKVAFPFEIDADQVKEVSVNTYSEDGYYPMNDQWAKFLDLIGSYRYERVSREDIEKLWGDDEELKGFYGVAFDCGEYIYWCHLLEDMLIVNRVSIFEYIEEEEQEFFITKHKDIIILQEELSQLDLHESIMVGKPVIYLYPEEEMDIKVSLSPKGVITTSYPEYDKGWFVTAKPSGELCDKDGKKYPYLFWEGDINFNGDFEEGFIVHKDKVIDFLETQLDTLGLNYVEKTDFITYWLPVLEKHDYNKIRFYTEEIEEWVALDVEPAPETLIRVYMIFEEAEGKETIAPQELKPVKRQGYTVVEWGGAEITGE